MGWVEDYERLIEVARRRLGARPVAPRRDLGGAEVQLSVRVPAGLRAAVAEVAALSNRSVTTFVTDVLSSAVAIETDPFAGLAADMTAHTRAVLGEAVRSGDYAAAAASVEAAERAT